MHTLPSLIRTISLCLDFVAKLYQNFLELDTSFIVQHFMKLARGQFRLMFINSWFLKRENTGRVTKNIEYFLQTYGFNPGKVCGDPENKEFGTVPDRSGLAYRTISTPSSADRFLFVTVPPTGVQVNDDFTMVKNGITTAYAEGASLTLTCTATGGKPLAKVSWWREGDLVTNHSQYFPDRRKSQSVLKIDKLIRPHLLAIYSCEVSNSRLQPPLVVRVAIDMYLRPLEVTLLGNNPEFSAGKRYNITCRCRGSRPPAIITWWKASIRFLDKLIGVGHLRAAVSLPHVVGLIPKDP
ncbi:hypothetical protein Zmor_020970 [Zophobas morio]|uniref:Ig-like domain-containing protein n=1 Tax=Zophobas morio TaxID=2755281 RepID=A0AA38I4Z5_9CUCU|nr:hypothetical protein Zmor_020970 [Zophobas morio]